MGRTTTRHQVVNRPLDFLSAGAVYRDMVHFQKQAEAFISQALDGTRSVDYPGFPQRLAAVQRLRLESRHLLH